MASQVILLGNNHDDESPVPQWQDISHMENHVSVVTRSGGRQQSPNEHTFRQLLKVLNDYIKYQIDNISPEATAGVLVLETP